MSNPGRLKVKPYSLKLRKGEKTEHEGKRDKFAARRVKKRENGGISALQFP